MVTCGFFPSPHLSAVQITLESVVRPAVKVVSRELSGGSEGYVFTFEKESVSAEVAKGSVDVSKTEVEIVDGSETVGSLYICVELKLLDKMEILEEDVVEDSDVVDREDKSEIEEEIGIEEAVADETGTDETGTEDDEDKNESAENEEADEDGAKEVDKDRIEEEKAEVVLEVEDEERIEVVGEDRTEEIGDEERKDDSTKDRLEEKDEIEELTSSIELDEIDSLEADSGDDGKVEESAVSIRLVQLQEAGTDVSVLQGVPTE